MLLAFVDESDQGDFHCFGAVLADENATKQLTERLNSLMRRACFDYGIPQNTEFHAHPMFHGKDAWQTVGQRARANLHEKVVDAIVESDVSLLLRHVSRKRLADRQDRKGYPERFPPEQVCFQHVLQRIDRVAQARSTYALVIADERGDRERHRERFATYQVAGTPGIYRHTTLPRLLDTVHFAPSHHSRMLQAADMLAFTYRRHQTVVEPDHRAQRIMDRLWSKLQDSGKLYEPGGWP
ncbi:DUF3800 domain-containing protein [Williamsia sp. CHRR-6]|uniref:DUF3800 domain-containing protein n=1 Tax=Williamsia sp. CHRR-6 TaxID=2835871 RepID=UPI001BDADAAB|nr:DUF3800 domain-containing protein [Williamsia sp. CHRR-6]MBT0567690.1 DUF3800 domain-containing protein [Williamsia sp. CHRR-6]